jgi:gamma-glutamylcyclotransferase (GGCT)/AIG2-like uncharacterized protein YtfP
MYLFVYGTLRKGFFNNKYLKEAEFIGEVKTYYKYTMMIENTLPFLLDVPLNHITGDLYKITPEILKKVDFLEGHPLLYTRKNIFVTNENFKEIIPFGRVKIAWAYFYNTTISETGDFKDHKEKGVNYVKGNNRNSTVWNRRKSRSHRYDDNRKYQHYNR